MMKKGRLFVSVLALVSMIGLGIVMAGCDAIGPSATTTTVKPATTTTTTSGTTTSTGASTTTTTGASTTTTTTSTTTTTQAPPYSISGTVSSGEAAWTDWGVLWVGVSTDEFDSWIAEGTTVVNTGETSVDYSVPSIDPGATTEVYLAAILYYGTSEVPGGFPPPNAPLGEYSDGLFKPFGTGVAQPVTLDKDLTGISWETNVVMITVEATFSGTVSWSIPTSPPAPVPYPAPLGPNNVLSVNASTDPSDLRNSVAYSITEAVLPFDTSKAFSLPIGQQGSYYIWAQLNINTAEARAPQLYDLRGEFSDDLLPAGTFGNWYILANYPATDDAETGNPQKVTQEGDDVTDINFNLGAYRGP